MTFIALRGKTATIRRQFSSLLLKVSGSSVQNHVFQGFASPIGVHCSTVRAFSYVEMGTITTPLKKLDAPTVRRIEDELRQVDRDSDGR